MRRILITPDELRKIYLDEKLSIRAIAKKTNCSCSGIKRLLHKYEVPRRNKCESLNLCPNSFTKREYEFLIGTILGNGHITKKRGENGECQLSLGHSTKQHKYIEWKHNEMKRFIGCRIYPLNHKLKNGKIYTTLNFITRKSKLFTELRNKFYDNFSKIVPFNILKKSLTPFSLAIWYMDDGYNYPQKGCEISTQSFSEKENLELINLFIEKFGIKPNIRKVVNKKNKLYFPKKQKAIFFEIIKDYIIPSMNYKLESPETIRQTLKNEDMVRSEWKHSEVGRNDQLALRVLCDQR